MDLAILVENGWSAIVPKSLAGGAPTKGKVDWKDIAARIARSYAIATAKKNSSRKSSAPKTETKTPVKKPSKKTAKTTARKNAGRA